MWISVLIRVHLPRKKIGQNIKFNGMKSLRKLASKHTDSFIFVYDPQLYEALEETLVNNNRDFDVIQEGLGIVHFICKKRKLFNLIFFTLGTISTQFYLESENYVPDRMMKKIDKATSSFVENGLRQFYESLVDFRQKLIDRVHLSQLDDDIQALTFEQLRRPMILVFCLWGITIIILILEIFISKWNASRRNRERKNVRDGRAIHPPRKQAAIIIYRPCKGVRRFIIRK